MAVRRLTGTKPVRRRTRKVRFRSRHGTKSHGGSVFRAHRGHRMGGAVFKAHANRALAVHKAKAIRALKAAKLAPYKGIKTGHPYPVRSKAAAYKAVGHHVPAGWAAKRKKLAKYRAVKAKRA